jgi:hypothetical protein
VSQLASLGTVSSFPAVTLVNFTEAAAVCGFKSRSALYRLRDSDQLAQYLRPAPGPGGRQLLELEPAGLPPLREHVARCVRPQVNNETRIKRARTDHRWEAVAADLSEALEACGGLQLSATEAETIAGALADAVADAFGVPGLERLRVSLADAGSWLAAPGSPFNADADREWWSEWGHWKPGEVLEDGPFWANVGPIAGAMMGPPFHGMSGPTAAELHHQLRDAVDEVNRGARWDAARWDAGSARMLLEDPDVSSGAEPLSRPELERLAADGLLSPELQAEVAAALAAYSAREQAEPLPVVLAD